MCCIYQEGFQCFNQFAGFGLQMDGTFLKTKHKGVLLRACFQDTQKNIMLLASAVVAVENTDNWKWFCNQINDALTVRPAFIMSDRHAGLIAAAPVFEGVPHYYCMRHVMENFNWVRE